MGFLEKFDKKVYLHQGFSTAHGDAALVSPITLESLCLIQQVIGAPLFSYPRLPGIRVVAELAAHGTTLQKDQKSDAWSIYRTKALYAVTRHSNVNILDCARYLSEIHKPVWIRHVLIPGITDKDEYLYQLRDFLSTLSNIERIDVLPYHTMGIYKYEKLGIAYPLEGIDPPTSDRIAHAEAILQEAL